ncbi:MAG: Mth938-like domain-containing protein [Planctomycetota bacterium]
MNQVVENCGINMHIDSYEFGRIVIDGVTYNADVLILGDTVRANWWRKQGHSLSIEDIESIIEASCDLLIIGCGAYSMMQVPQQTKKFLQEKGIRFESADTNKAVLRFNEATGEGLKVAAGLHLTC